MRIKFEKMNKLKLLNLFLLVVLGVAAGSAKIAKTPEELSFFQQLGLSESVLLVFGVIQVLAAVLLIFNQVRLFGIATLAVTFLSSTIMILIAGQLGFAVFSLLPLIMLYFAFKYSLNSVESNSSKEKQL